MGHTFNGSCHCGAVRFTYQGEAIEKGLRCNCSLCKRKGALMSSEVIAPEAMQIEAEEGALGLYRFGDGTARHYFCKTCGIYTHHQRRSDPRECGINLGCIDGVNPRDLGDIPWTDGVNHPSDR